MDFPIELRERMLAEQMAMMEALQFIAQLLICFVTLLALVILFVNLSGIVRTRLSERRPSERRQLHPAVHHRGRELGVSETETQSIAVLEHL